MGQYLAQMVIFVVTVIGAIFFNKLYTRSRGQPRLEELLALYKAVTLGSLLAIAFISFLLKNIIDYRRPMLVLAWLLTLLLLTFSRVLHIQLQRWLMRRGVGNSDVLLVGTGEVARMVLQKMLNSPQLGYRPIGLVAVEDGPQKMLGLPVLGKIADLPQHHREAAGAGGDHLPAGSHPPRSGAYRFAVRARAGDDPHLPRRVPDHGVGGQHQ